MHYILYSVQYTLYTIHCIQCIHRTLYTVTIHCHYTLYTIHCTLYTIHYTLYTVHYTLYTIHYTLYTIHYTLYTVHYTLSLYTVHYTLYVNGTNRQLPVGSIPTAPRLSSRHFLRNILPLVVPTLRSSRRLATDPLPNRLR